MSRTKMLRNGLFAAATLSALGFGAAQAFAAPAAPTSRFACNPWDEPRCIEYCQNKGADTGTCDERYVNFCRCIYW